MKETKVEDLRVGDLIYYCDGYYEVMSTTTGLYPLIKCIVGPTNKYITAGSKLRVVNMVPILLLCRDGVEV